MLELIVPGCLLLGCLLAMLFILFRPRREPYVRDVTRTGNGYGPRKRGWS